MSERQEMTGYIASFVDELARNNVKNVVVSPGSRSTPLSLLLAEHPDITIHLNIDERSAAFFALGLAKALKNPVGLVCTSGTATANYYPAIVEAYYSRVPLVVMTADRPHELRDVGAPQAINQIELYGKHTKWFVEMALPESTPEMLKYARTVCSRAIATAQKEPAGPVHLNFPLREPLLPDLEKAEQYRDVSQNDYPFTTVELGELILSQSQFENIAGLLGRANRGIIVCGELRNRDMRGAIVSLAEKLGFPLIADPLSQLRSGNHSHENIIDCYDTFLRDEHAKTAFKPDLVLRFGAMPVSKALLQYLKKHSSAQHLVVDGGAGWREPAGLVTNMIYCNEISFGKHIIELLETKPTDRWLTSWRTINNRTKDILRVIRDEDVLSEGKLFLLLNDLMPENSHLFVGNSMPIRDLDTFFFNNNKEIMTSANRGANGIDGVVSTALGMSTVVDKTVLVIGDLSFFHDMNGLMAAKLQKQNLTILLINNDGGGIFSFLPQSSEKKHFETLFGTPHGLDFTHAVQLYDGKYAKVDSWDHLHHVFSKSLENEGLNVIEVPTERETNVTKHRNLWNSVSREISMVLSEIINDED
jgi:2-succinyl-5-enolpyruvyl-6-hydroxy-3-cyclohexene-1-carboxylate synthase